MRVVPLELGRIEAELRVINGEPGSVMFPIPGWLIEHRDGLVLFDNGMHRDLQHDISRLGRTGEVFRPHYEPGEEVAARLSERGINPSDINLMIFSHLHFDHAGGTGDLPEARLLVQRAEWEAGHDQKLIEQGVYDPVDYDHGHDVQLVEGQHDVFGDGKLVCLPTPGHTAGHQALRVELDSGPVVLTGDCVYFEQMLDDMVVPRFGHDAEMQLESMKELAALRDAGCRMIYGHDDAQFRSLLKTGLE